MHTFIGQNKKFGIRLKINFVLKINCCEFRTKLKNNKNLSKFFFFFSTLDILT